MIGEKAILVLITEQGGHREKVFLGDRVVLVVVAARTLHRQTHEAVARCTDAVVNAVLAKFLGDGAAFERHPVQAIESRRHALVLGGIRKEVARQLLGQELIVRLIIIERLQDPVAPGPSEHPIVPGVAPSISVTREV